jgi:hypothetical protein
MDRTDSIKSARFHRALLRSSGVVVHDAGSAQLVQMTSTQDPQLLESFCGKAVNFISCCGATTGRGGRSEGVRSGLFAYNETPTIAVAIDCWLGRVSS